MKKFKILIPIIMILLIIILIVFIVCQKNWIIRFSNYLDDFFGEDNWKYIDEETKESILVDKHVHFHRNPEFDFDTPDKYKKWYILFNDKNGEEEIYEISNHVYIISKDKYNFFSSSRYSAKQSLTAELMDISISKINDDILKKYISTTLPSNVSDCIGVDISYIGGNPGPKFYDKLSKQSWFNIHDIDAEKYLSTDLYDFYIDIKAYDYKVEKLSDEEQQELFDSMSVIEEKLVKDFGSNASFEIYFAKDCHVEYADGVKK